MMNLDDAGLDGGARTYASLLRRAGGDEVQALMRPGDERAVCAALYTAPPYDLRVPGMAVARLSINLTPACVTGGVEDERARSHDARRYSLFFVPAGAEAAWRKATPSRHLTLYFRPDALAGGQDSGAPLARPEAMHNLQVPGLRPLADQLADELRQGDPFQPDAADCLARLLLIQVSRHLCKARDEPQAFGTASIARLKDYVMAHLGERIRVADLAREAGMSVDRFAWAFKAQTGLSPHQYVLAQRLAQARHLLLATRRPIAEVAFICGFSSQQHLTHLMRRQAGTTPAQLRRSA